MRGLNGRSLPMRTPGAGVQRTSANLRYRTTDYYVDGTNGNDTTGDGSMAAPWKTIHKAVTTVPQAGNLSIGIYPGTYQEDSGSGYLLITRAFTAPVELCSLSRNANDVIIQGASSTSYDTLILANGGNLVFSDLTFAMRTNATVNGALRIARGSNLTFNRCKFSALAAAGNIRLALYIAESSTYIIQNVTFNDCTVGVVGSDPAYGAHVTTAGTGTINNIVFNNCIASATGYAFYATGGTNININGGTFTNASGRTALAYGKDATTSTTSVTGTVDGATIQSNTSHSALIGAGAGGVIVKNCHIIGGDYGLIAKENALVQFLNNTITDGTSGSLYFKAATGAIATGNIISNAVGGPCVRLAAGDTGNKSGTVTLTGNQMTGAGTSSIYAWADDTGDSGGCVVDYNTYILRNGATLGKVRGVVVNTMAELRAAWAGYGDGSNDANSTVV